MRPSYTKETYKSNQVLKELGLTGPVLAFVYRVGLEVWHGGLLFFFQVQVTPTQVIDNQLFAGGFSLEIF